MSRRQPAEQGPLLAAAIESIDQGILVYDRGLRVVAFNRRALEILDLPADRFAVGGPFEDWVRHTAEGGGYGGAGPVEERMARRLDIARSFEPFRTDQTRADGKVIEINGHPIPGGGYVTTYTDVTERKRAEAEIRRQRDALRELADRDALTGLYNRRYLMQRGDEEFERVRRSGNRFSVVMLDCDRFKAVNDTYGHAVGDEVLCRVAEECQRAVRGIDVPARYGGEEFAIFLPISTLAGARTVAGRIRAAVGCLPTATAQGPIDISVSAGIAAFAADDPSFAGVLNRADALLYRAKELGRNRVEG
jgi:diguanylate cyclase (GGDEF)-like protein